MSSDQSDIELERLVQELSNILGYDKDILNCFILMLKNEDELNEQKLAIKMGISVPSASNILKKMLEDGLVIKGKDGYLPLHPRLAISNLYRLSVSKDEKARQYRVRVDAITAMLVKLRESVQRW
ncbi:MAG: MarR family transcriptional regulator [Conexivisphaerales archaeon]